MPDDPSIDDALRNLPVPDALTRRCGPADVFDDAVIDRGLRSVVVPVGLAERMAAAARSGRRPIDLDRRGGWIESRPDAPAHRGLGTMRRSIVSCLWAAGMTAVPLAVMAAVFLTGRALSRRLERSPAPRASASTTAAVPAAAEEHAPVGVPASLPSSAAVVAATPHGAAPPMVAPAPDVAPAPLVRGAVVDDTAVDDRGLRFAPPLGDVRRAVPRTRGYDLAFEMLHGEQPFVQPAAGAGLAVSRPPLLTGVDWLTIGVERGGRRGAAWRVEELLAALPVPAALPEDLTVTVRAVPGRRVFEGRATVLVDVAVAAPRAVVPRPPVEATVVLARSVAGGQLAWRWSCAALGAVGRALGPGDVLSVVVTGRTPAVVARTLPAADVGALADSLMDWPVDGSGDLDAAVRTAEEFAAPVVVVAGAEVLDRCRAEARRALLAWQARLAEGDAEAAVAVPGTAFVVVDAAVASRADAEPAFGRTPLDAVAIRRSLLQAVCGGAQDVARDCRLEVGFDPRAVLAYRLIGHRQSAVESAAPGGPAGVTLHAGETARAVYEVVLAPEARGRWVEATCSWLPPGAATARTARAGLDVAGIAGVDALPDAAGCELLLTAGVGDLLADSPHAAPRGPLSDALRSLAARWRERGDVTPGGTRAIAALDALDGGRP